MSIGALTVMNDGVGPVKAQTVTEKQIRSSLPAHIVATCFEYEGGVAVRIPNGQGLGRVSAMAAFGAAGLPAPAWARKENTMHGVCETFAWQTAAEKIEYQLRSLSSLLGMAAQGAELTGGRSAAGEVRQLVLDLSKTKAGRDALATRWDALADRHPNLTPQHRLWYDRLVGASVFDDDVKRL